MYLDERVQFSTPVTVLNGRQRQDGSSSPEQCWLTLLHLSTRDEALCEWLSAKDLVALRELSMNG